ncbi:hypothetical protein ACFFX0_14000 [Citricoccus parietis]|uniref:Uncharacterized protein n=1 Tax=Citricoccus parietis TaxID=592307 RepID=A0ABV5G004_9MICC
MKDSWSCRIVRVRRAVRACAPQAVAKRLAGRARPRVWRKVRPGPTGARIPARRSSGSTRWDSSAASVSRTAGWIRTPPATDSSSVR